MVAYVDSATKKKLTTDTTPRGKALASQPSNQPTHQSSLHHAIQSTATGMQFATTTSSNCTVTAYTSEANINLNRS